MTLIPTPTYVDRIECDKPGCTARVFPRRPDTRTFSRDVDNLLSGHGWSIWISRSRRYYCPDHTPGPKTKMRRVL